MKKHLTLIFTLFIVISSNAQSIPETILGPEGLTLPRLTATEKKALSLEPGRMLYNITDHEIVYQDNCGWMSLASNTDVLEMIVNQFQPYVSTTGDRLYLAPGKFVVIPGISAAASTVTDIDGNTYNTIDINGDKWIAENLKTKKYANGDPIPDGTLVIPGGFNVTDDYWFVYNDIPVYENIYGLHYTHATVTDPRGLCPTGWHPATEAEWNAMINFVNISYPGVVANALKAQLAGWQVSPPFYVPIDAYGFAVLPAATHNESFNWINTNSGRFWLFDQGQNSSNNGRAAFFSSTSEMVSIQDHFKTEGFNVRCVQD